MKNFTIKTICAVVFFFIIAAITVNGQKVVISVNDNGIPGYGINDVYEIGYLVGHWNGSTFDQTWDSPTATYITNSGSFPFPTMTPFGINNFNPLDGQAHYKVLITIKRRTAGDIICGGQKFSGFMTPYEILNVQFSVGPVILTNP